VTLLRRRDYHVRLIKAEITRPTGITNPHRGSYIFWLGIEVGSPISRGLFAAAQIRPRILLWGDKKNFGGDQTNGFTTPQLEVFLCQL
jgi:hypothetical protein